MPRVLIVDDDQLIHDVLGTILDLEEVEVVTAMDAQRALDVLGGRPVDLVVCDVMMPGMDGFELCEKLRADERFNGLPIVLLTARDEGRDRARATEVGADAYLTKPFSPLALLDTIQSLITEGGTLMQPDTDQVEAMREQLMLFAKDLRTVGEQAQERREEAEEALGEVRSAYLNIVRTLALVCEMKDATTRNHLDRTYQYAMHLTRRVAPEYANEAAIGYGYLLHDIGKVGIPDSVLLKPGPLDDHEWEVMRTHPVIGRQLLSNIDFMGDALKIVKSHHERWDGRGYPEGIAGEEIYLPARIFTIIDTFDAMTSDRPYRSALPLEDALEEIERVGGTQFDPDLATAFVDMCEEAGLGQPGATKDSLAFVK